MSTTPSYGQISPERAAQMKANLPERDHAVIDLLTVRPAPVRASGTPDDGDEYSGFGHLCAAKTPAEADERRELAEHIAASAAEADDDDALFDALFGPDRRPQR